MEESYIVHRRRKAAARNREKTPESSKSLAGLLLDDDDDDVEVDARAKIEKMVEDTEKMEEFVVGGSQKHSADGEKKPESNANSKQELKPEQVEASCNESKSSSRKMKSDFEKGSSKNRSSPVMCDTKKIVQVGGEREKISKDEQQNLQKIQSPTRRKRRHKIVADQKKYEYLTYSSEEENDYVEKRKVKYKKSTSLREDNDNVESSSANDVRIRKQRGTKGKRERVGGQDSASEYDHKVKEDKRIKKQIIPLSNESLIDDFAKAEEQYLRRERRDQHIMDFDSDEINQDSLLRKRKSSIIHTESEKKEIIETIADQSDKRNKWDKWRRLFSWPRFSLFQQQARVAQQQSSRQSSNKTVEFVKSLRDLSAELKEFLEQNPRQVDMMLRLRNRCFAELIVIIIYCGLGAFMFRFTEGAFETFYKCGVKRVKRDFLDSLWINSHKYREDEWKSLARRKLMEFEEQLHAAHEAGVHSYSGQKSWTFLNAVVYCLTVITTIGEFIHKLRSPFNLTNFFPFLPLPVLENHWPSDSDSESKLVYQIDDKEHFKGIQTNLRQLVLPLNLNSTKYSSVELIIQQLL